MRIMWCGKHYQTNNYTNNMEFTNKQKIAIVKVLYDIIRVDGKIDSRETTVLDGIIQDLNLNPEGHFKTLEYNTLLSLSEIKAMTEEQKKYCSDLVRKIITADEEIAESERTVYANICAFCGIPDLLLAPYVTIDSFIDYLIEEMEFINPYIEARAVEARIRDAEGNDTGETEKVLVINGFGNITRDDGNIEINDTIGLPVVHETDDIWSSHILDDETFELFRNRRRIDDATLRWGCWRDSENDEPRWAKTPRVYSVVLNGKRIVLNGPKRASRFEDDYESPVLNDD